MTQPHKQPRVRPDTEWLPLVNDILGSNARAHDIARSIMWCKVIFYVEHIARLPIGPLNDDDEARRDIAMRVLEKLEAKEYFHLKEWRLRHLCKRDDASLWGLIHAVLRTTAIDYARTSRQNIARRGEPFEWVRVEYVDPFELGERLGTTLDFFAHCGEQELHEFIANAQHAQRDDDAVVVEITNDDDAPRACGSQAMRPWP